MDPLAQSFHLTLRVLTGQRSGGPLSDPALVQTIVQAPGLQLDPEELDSPLDDSDQGIESLRALLNDQLLPQRASQIHTSWLTDEGPREEGVDTPTQGLPEGVLVHLPGSLRDEVAVAVGTVSRAHGRLSPEAALELARWRWDGLYPMPDPESKRLTHRLVNQPPERLQRLVERLGLHAFAGFLAHIPERAGASLCRRLPPALAREAWSTRRQAASEKSRGHAAQGISPEGKAGSPRSWRPNRQALEAGLMSHPMKSLWRMGAYVLCRALSESPETLVTLAQRLPKKRGIHILELLKTRRHLGADLPEQEAQELLAQEMRLTTTKLREALCSRAL